MCSSVVEADFAVEATDLADTASLHFVCHVSDRYGSTYITSDNFPAQKISFKNGVALSFSPLVPKLHNPSMLVMTGLQSGMGGFVLLTL